MEEKRTFILSTDHEEDIDILTDEEAGQIFKAIFKYINRGQEPEFEDRLLRIIFKRIKRDLDTLGR